MAEVLEFFNLDLTLRPLYLEFTPMVTSIKSIINSKHHYPRLIYKYKILIFDQTMIKMHPVNVGYHLDLLAIEL